MKRRLAAEASDDIDAYIAGKTDFLVGILREAGFSHDDLDEITRMNERS